MKALLSTRILRGVWLLAGWSAVAVQADLGPALSGLTAQADNATTVFWSPAGITRLDQQELLVGATLAVTESKFEVDESNRSGGSADNDTSLLAIPSFYYAHPINDKWSAGAALTVPSGFGNTYGKSWSGRYLSEESDLAFVALSGTLGYRFNDHWSIGGGPIVLYTDSTSKARVNNLVGPDGKIELEEDGFGLGWQLGLMYEFSESARIGAVYRAEIDPDLSRLALEFCHGAITRVVGVKNESLCAPGHVQPNRGIAGFIGIDLDGLVADPDRAVVLDRHLAVDRVTQRVDHAAQQPPALGHFEDAARALHGVALGDVLVVAQDDRTDRVALEVERHAEDIAGELDHLALHDISQAMNAGNAVGQADDGSLGARLGDCLELLDAALYQIADFSGIELHSCCFLYQ